MITVAEIRSYVGTMPASGTIQCERGDMVETSWRGVLDGRAGWWFVLTRGTDVLALWWTTGDRRDRDLELSRALAAHALAVIA
jgi:hypothetical protein